MNTIKTIFPTLSTMPALNKEKLLLKLLNDYLIENNNDFKRKQHTSNEDITFIVTFVMSDFFQREEIPHVFPVTYDPILRDFIMILESPKSKSTILASELYNEMLSHKNFDKYIEAIRNHSVGKFLSTEETYDQSFCDAYFNKLKRLSNEEFHLRMVGKYKENTDPSGGPSDEFMKVYEAQGASLSINHHIPAMETMMQTFSEGAESLTNSSPFATVTSFLKTSFGICCDYKFWLTIYIVVSIFSLASSQTPSKSKAIRSLKYISLSAMMLTMLYSEICSSPDLEEKFEETKRHFWNELAPEWRIVKEDINSDPEEEVEMGPVYVPQGLSDLVPGMSIGLLGCLSILIGHKVKAEMLTSLMLFSKVSPMQVTNVTAALVFGFGAISKFFKSVDLNNVSNFFEVDPVNDKRVERFVDKTRSFLSRISMGDVQNIAWYAEVYQELREEGGRLTKIIDKKDYDFRILGEYLRKLESAQDKVDAFNKSLKGNRVEPVALLLRGAPGIGKSVFMNRIAHMLAKTTIPREWAEDYKTNPEKFIYSLPIDKFWDGYTNKAFVVLADDFGQKRDGPGDADSEAIKMIKMVNTAEMTLPMANVDLKNTVTFTSKFIIATTNLPDFRQVASINDVTALDRRMNIDLSVTVNPKYQTPDGKIDKDRLPRVKFLEDGTIDDLVNKSTYFPNDFWVLSLSDKGMDGVEIQRPITFPQLIKLTITKHHERIRNFYVNHLTEQQALSELSNELEEYFPDMEMYSDAVFKTYKPQGINTLPGTFWRCPDEFERIFNRMNPKLQKQFFKLYVEEFSVGYRYKGYAYDGIVGLVKHLKLLEAPITTIIIDKLENLDFSGCIEELKRTILQREEKGLHPLEDTSLFLMELKKIEPATVLESITNTVMPVFQFVEKHKLLLLMGGAMVVSASFWLGGLLNIFLPVDEEATFEAQSADFRRDRMQVGKKPAKPVKGKVVTSLRPQGAYMDLNVRVEDFVPPETDYTSFFNGTKHDVLEKVIKKYHYIIYLTYKNKDSDVVVVRLGHAINLQGRIFLLPYHFILQTMDIFMDPNFEGGALIFTTVSKSTCYKVAIDDDFFNSYGSNKESCENDCALLEVKSAHPTSVGALKYFLKDGDVEKLARTSAFNIVLLGTSRDSEGVQHVRAEKTRANFQNAVLVKSMWAHKPEFRHYKLENVVRYTGHKFTSGDCGTISAVLGHDFENRCILGIHAAGEDDYGFSTCVTQELLLNIIGQKFPTSKIFEEEEIFPHCIETPVEAQGLMLPIAKLIPPYIPGSITKSEIARSELFGCLPEPYNVVEKYPARLSPFKDKETGVTIDPLLLAVSYYAKKEPICFPEGIIDHAIASYESLILNNLESKLEFKRKIPIEEALHAFENVRGIASGTSAGFPHNLPISENIKKEYFTAIYENNPDKISSSLKRIAILVEEVEEKFKRGIRPATFYKDCNKDEVIKLEKVKAGKTRLFSSGDFIYLLMFRMYFGAFMSGYFKANVDVGSAIGLNCYSRDWDKLANIMRKFNTHRDEKRFGAGDYSKFDTNEKPQVLWAILGIINRWYGNNNPENYIRTCLWAEITNSRHIVRGDIYEWYNGLPSGNALTPLVNTMYNNILFRLAYQFAGFSASTFNANVVVVTLGDDNIFAVSDEVKDHFNELLLPDLMDKCGMVYTTEFKDTAVVPLRALNEISFLKRTFRYDAKFNRWVAPLDMASIMGPLNWTKKGILRNQITADMIPSALGELSLHGKKVFEQYAGKLVDLKNSKIPGVVPAKEISLNFNFVYADVLKSELFTY